MKRASYAGQCLSWKHVGSTIEVELHKGPCNEIGTRSLTELEILAAHIREGAHNARALIFHSSRPGGFCAGADLRELYASLSGRAVPTTGVARTLRERLRQTVQAAVAWPRLRLTERLSKAVRGRNVRSFLDRIHTAFDVFDRAPLVTIAATHGVVFGGGFELALTCDVIVADKSARFCFPELRLGLIPGFGGIPRLRRDVGNSVVRDLLLTGRSLGAPRAHELGLVAHLVGRGEALHAARSIAAQAARFDQATSVAAKAFLKTVPEEELAREKELFCQLFASPVVERALADFVRRSDPLPYLP